MTKTTQPSSRLSAHSIGWFSQKEQIKDQDRSSTHATIVITTHYTTPFYKFLYDHVQNWSSYEHSHDCFSMIMVRTVYPPPWLPSTITTPNTTTARIAYHTIPISTLHCQWRPRRLLYNHDQGIHSFLATKTVNPRSQSRNTLLVNDKDAFSSLSSYILPAHVGPVYSGRQTQVAFPDTPSHVPLFWQGSGSHGSGIASELKCITLKTYINWECPSCDHGHDYPSSGHGHH
jgi:hypothetical protein